MSDTCEYEYLRLFILVLSTNTREYRIFVYSQILVIIPEYLWSKTNTNTSINLAALTNIRICECILVTLLACSIPCMYGRLRTDVQAFFGQLTLTCTCSFGGIWVFIDL